MDKIQIDMKVVLILSCNSRQESNEAHFLKCLTIPLMLHFCHVCVLTTVRHYEMTSLQFLYTPAV